MPSTPTARKSAYFIPLPVKPWLDGFSPKLVVYFLVGKHLYQEAVGCGSAYNAVSLL